MKKLQQTILFALLLACGACQHEELDTGSGNDGYVEFRFTKPDNEASTRADIAEDGSGTFAEGDKISLYITAEDGVARHIVLTLKSGAWTPQLKKSDLGKDRVILNACYPADEDATEISAYAFRLSANQSGKEYESSDLLRSHRSVDMATLSGNRIEMPFAHALHRLVVKLDSKGEALPDDLGMRICGKLQGTVDLQSGMAMASDAAAEWIIPRKLGEGRYCAVFYPQKLKQGEGWVKITANGKESVYEAPATVGGKSSLEAGRQTTLRLTLKQNGTADPDPSEWANSQRWVYGIEAPVYNPDEIEVCFPGSPERFPSDKWFKAGEFSREYLNWSQVWGWYDCDKRNLRGDYPEFPEDGNMCWAAAASNLLHWWMYHNLEYIVKYDEVYGRTPYPKYPRPSMEFTDTKESEIFDFFRKNFKNSGNWDDAGVNWFINGTVGKLLPNNPDIESQFHGYFKEVFAGTSVATLHWMYTKEDFNRIVKQALNSRQALGFVRVSLSGGRDFHDMVIWGAEFDASGDVSAIYYVDNNDYYEFKVTGGTDDYQHHRIIRTPIWYKDDDVWPVHMGTGNSTYIGTLTTVDLGRNIWQRAFPEVQPEDE